MGILINGANIPLHMLRLADALDEIEPMAEGCQCTHFLPPYHACDGLAKGIVCYVKRREDFPRLDLSCVTFLRHNEAMGEITVLLAWQLSSRTPEDLKRELAEKRDLFRTKFSQACGYYVPSETAPDRERIEALIFGEYDRLMA